MDSCGGFCLPLGSGATVTASFCSRRCVVGNLMGCGWADKAMSLATGGPHGICLLTSGDADVGDMGYCVQQCATVADCTNKDPGGKCDTTTLDAQLNSHGFCSWN